jgi:hypothetical protein
MINCRIRNSAVNCEVGDLSGQGCGTSFDEGSVVYMGSITN